MNWEYTIFDAVQLMIPVVCTMLTLGVSLVYIFLYKNLRERLYLAGFLMSLSATAFVFFESLVIVAGWMNIIEIGRIFHMTEQLIGVYFLFTMMLFASAISDAPLNRISRYLAYIGLGIAILITISSIINPELFVSLSQKNEYGYVTLGDLARGKEGPLYSLRDILLGLYLLTLIIISIKALIQHKGDFKYLFIVMGTLIAAFSALDDLSHFHFGRNFLFNNFKFSRFSVGTVSMNFLMLIGILDDYFRTQRHLKEAHSDLVLTHSRLQSSEQKYRRLTEGADQAVFSLSKDFFFISFNKKAKAFFNLTEERLKLPFPDLIINSDRNEKGISKQIILENLSQLSLVKESVHFHAVQNDPRTLEPEELEFSIDYFKAEDGTVEYICRAEKRKGSRLIRSIEQERLQLSIENYIVAIDDVTTRLTSALYKFVDSGSSLMIKMGLQEMIINAIEHGNLNISFEEKTRAIQNNTYLDFIRERQQDPRYKERTVRIDYILNKGRVQYMISDEGDGFHYDETMRKVDQSVDQEQLPHGRGINLARVLFDSVKYNSKGNQVLLIKNF